MNRQSWQKLAESDYWKLIPVILLAFFIAFIPHLSYPYPLHVDEWENLARSGAIMSAGGITSVDPLTGSAINVSSELEAGFHVFWGVFQAISGISWIDIYRFFPAIIFVFTVLAVYILARREGFGWEAAFFTCLIPTTVGILGPAFLVPVTTGLFFVPLVLFLAINYRTFWVYLVIFLFVCFLLTMHAPSAILLMVIITPYVLINLRSNFRHSLSVSSALILPFIITLPLTFDLIGTSARELIEPQYVHWFVELPQMLMVYGFLPVLVCLLGCAALAKNYGDRNYGLLLGLMTILLLQCVFYTFHYGIPLIYERSLLYAMLMISVVAGAGLALIQKTRVNFNFMKAPEMHWLAGNLGKVFSVAIICIILIIAIPERMNTPYYHMIDEADYQAFVWIQDNVDDRYEKAVLEPWKGAAFTAVTGKHVYSWISGYPTERDIQARDFFENNCRDTAFLRQNGVSIVYTRWVCDNPDLVQVRKYVYLLELQK